MQFCCSGQNIVLCGVSKLHSRFDRPSTEIFAYLIPHAFPGNFTFTTRHFLDNIVACCKSRQRMAPEPFVFKIVMSDDIVYNHEINVLCIEKRSNPPVIQMFYGNSILCRIIGRTTLISGILLRFFGFLCA